MRPLRAAEAGGPGPGSTAAPARSLRPRAAAGARVRGRARGACRRRRRRCRSIASSASDWSALRPSGRSPASGPGRLAAGPACPRLRGCGGLRRPSSARRRRPFCARAAASCGGAWRARLLCARPWLRGLPAVLRRSPLAARLAAALFGRMPERPLWLVCSTASASVPSGPSRAEPAGLPLCRFLGHGGLTPVRCVRARAAGRREPRAIDCAASK